MKIDMFPAKSGDCFVISYGEKVDKHIIIDGGFVDTYRDALSAYIEDINDNGHTIELILVTHIDRDHIGGILELIKSRHELNFNDIWHNSYRHLDCDYESVEPKYFSILEDIIASGNKYLTHQKKKYLLNKALC